MYIRLAYRQMEQMRKINLLAGIQQAVTFILCICCVSILLSQTRLMSGLWEYLGQKGVYVQIDGIVDWDNMMMVQDKAWVEDRLNSANIICCYSVDGEYINMESNQLIEMEGRAYDEEIIEAYMPEMLEGNWLGEASKEPGRLNVVISENMLGLKTGDKISVSDGEKTLEAVIAGVVKNQSEVYGYSCPEETEQDYKMFYEMRDVETENRPIVLMDKRELEESNVGAPIWNSMIITYDKGITKQEAEENRRFLAEECEVGSIQELAEIRENSISYLWSRMSVILPVFICSVVLTILTQLTTSVIIGKRNLRNFMIYQLCGAEKRQIRRIVIGQSALLTGKAAVFTFLAVWFFQMAGILDKTIINLGGYQVLACMITGISHILISYAVQGHMLNNTTVIQGINKTQDSEG